MQVKQYIFHYDDKCLCKWYVGKSKRIVFLYHKYVIVIAVAWMQKSDVLMYFFFKWTIKNKSWVFLIRNQLL